MSPKREWPNTFERTGSIETEIKHNRLTSSESSESASSRINRSFFFLSLLNTERRNVLRNTSVGMEPGNQINSQWTVNRFTFKFDETARLKCDKDRRQQTGEVKINGQAILTAWKVSIETFESKS